MKQVGMKNIIFSSSATVYTADNEMPLKETSRTGNCTNPYGWTKFMTEQILSGVAHADKDWSIALLRYFNPIGAHESGIIGEDPRGIPNNLMPYITQVAIGRREFLSVYGNDYDTPDGTGVRDYIHVVDLAKGHVAAVKFVLEHKGCEVFNLGTGNGVSVLDMVKAFNEANGLNLPYKIVGRRPGDIAVCYADPSRSEKLLNWKAEKDLRDMVRDSWNWQSKNPMGYGE
jgi:UDP-glucose 4-epimerase